MICSHFLPNWSLQNPNPKTLKNPKNHTKIKCTLRDLRTRIETVKNTQKITEAMKLVAAAKVRKAQENVTKSRPFTQKLLEFLKYVNDQLILDDIETPLTCIRPVKNVALVVITGDRGLCGGFNSQILKKAEKRIIELKNMGLGCVVISVGKKGNSYFRRKIQNFENLNDLENLKIDRFIESGGFPTAKEAQSVADDVFSYFISEEVDKVEILYTKFVSLIKSDPVIQTLLPLSKKGEVVDVNGKCVDSVNDEFFRLTSKEGKLSVLREKESVEKDEFLCNLEFEQDPVQIVDAMMPLYLNSQILRALQESLASELAARMEGLGQRMSPIEYRFILKYRLLFSLYREGDMCPACHRFRLDSFGEHATHCRNLSGFKYRHDLVRDTLYDIIWRAGISARKEAPVKFLQQIQLKEDLTLDQQMF